MMMYDTVNLFRAILDLKAESSYSSWAVFRKSLWTPVSSMLKVSARLDIGLCLGSQLSCSDATNSPLKLTTTLRWGATKILVG